MQKDSIEALLQNRDALSHGFIIKCYETGPLSVFARELFTSSNFPSGTETDNVLPSFLPATNKELSSQNSVNNKSVTRNTLSHSLTTQ